MAERKQHIVEESPSKKYFHQMLNMADDDLDPYEYRLLGHYIRVGDCYQSNKTTAEITRMSTGQVTKKRRALADKGYIRLEKPGEHDKGLGLTMRVIIVDRWAENIARYAEKTTVHTVNAPQKEAESEIETPINSGEGVHQVNERRTKELLFSTNVENSAEISALPSQNSTDEKPPPMEDEKSSVTLFTQQVYFGAIQEAINPPPYNLIMPSRSMIGRIAKWLRTQDVPFVPDDVAGIIQHIADIAKEDGWSRWHLTCVETYATDWKAKGPGATNPNKPPPEPARKYVPESNINPYALARRKAWVAAQGTAEEKAQWARDHGEVL